MEIDFIENVNGLDENVVRLYNFDKAEAIKFRDLNFDNFKGVNISAKKNPINIAVTETAIVIKVA